jgi:hypothetical protein
VLSTSGWTWWTTSTASGPEQSCEPAAER